MVEHAAHEFWDEQRIIDEAIEEWNPVTIVCLFSGGYDSMIATNLMHESLDSHGLPLKVWSIDTCLSADGWSEYVRSIGEQYGWDHTVHRNEKGFKQFVESVKLIGCPRTRSGHTYAFQKLKERSIDHALKIHKNNRGDKVLFVSGMRRAESIARRNTDESHRIGKSNKIFAAPIAHWSNEDCMIYRVNNDLPENPFYNTVKGSGDCQCNWGNFITLGTLEMYSPKLAIGNVKLIHEISLENHGYGWDGSQGETLFELPDIEQERIDLTSPFLCQGCSRSNPTPPSNSQIETVMTQRNLF